MSSDNYPLLVSSFSIYNGPRGECSLEFRVLQDLHIALGGVRCELRGWNPPNGAGANGGRTIFVKCASHRCVAKTSGHAGPAPIRASGNESKPGKDFLSRRPARGLDSARGSAEDSLFSPTTHMTLRPPPHILPPQKISLLALLRGRPRRPRRRRRRLPERHRSGLCRRAGYPGGRRQQ